ncbi:hypothetical protein Xmau_02935 [Xenorhabdus mauleonii]|uniref:tRNA_anti-like n=1 Tax=Xenorhabdus mauleonii TaxID=351675 RepID=A0A1I3TA73_9GAMM|nr:hypothetical protein [Xenorhabdus mauleonii]PHM39328.1 hypothetical protein Xmau_02935 [Xenorhabdus mauleonii]SFJ67510.1 tRNA_anti-like [Xenorhabdus mauleonii]
MKKILKWVGIIFVVLLVIGIIAGKDENSSESTSSSSSAIKLTENELDVVKNIIRTDVKNGFNNGGSKLNTDYVVVSAREMQRTYASNEARGDKTYKGKKIIITGIVDTIDSSIGDIPVVTLKTGDMFYKVHVNFDRKYRDLAADLDRNQKVTYACVGESVIIGSPTVGDCVPVSVAEDKLVDKLVSSVNKALKNPSKATEEDKSMIMFAKIASVSTDDFKTCKATDVKCLSSSIDKYGKDNLDSNAELKALAEKLGLHSETKQ